MNKKFDVTLSGVVNNGFQEVNPQLATFKMFVTGAVLNNQKGAKWNFPLPTLISITLRDFSNLSPEDRYALTVTGSEVNVRVSGEKGNLESEVISVVGRTRSTLEDYVIALEETPQRNSEEK